MHGRYLFGTFALLVSAAGLTAALSPQDKPKEAKPASAPAMDDEMMAKMMKYGTPGAEHKLLDPMAGKWTYTSKWRMEPGAPEQESTGTSEAKWMYDGRYMTADLNGDMGGMPWNGHAISGFDNMKKKYVSTFVDSMSTAIMVLEGTYDPATKTFTWKGEGPNVMLDKYTPFRMVDKIVDANKFTSEFYCTDKTGKEYKAGEMTYTRAK